MPGLLTKLGKTTGATHGHFPVLVASKTLLFDIPSPLLPDEIINITEAASRVADENEGQLRFDDFVSIVEQQDNASEVPFEGPDPKVVEFLRILEEYRVKCEEEGNYLEAGRAHKQLSILRKQVRRVLLYTTPCVVSALFFFSRRVFRRPICPNNAQEEKRQQKAVRARQIAERQDVQLAHNMQFSDFNAAWDQYMEVRPCPLRIATWCVTCLDPTSRYPAPLVAQYQEYDNMAQMYIQQMTERHALVLLEFQKQLRQELLARPPKWSKELLEMRRKQHIAARNKQYAEAQKLKKVCDKIEESERKDMEAGQAVNFAKKEAKYRLQQQAELQALLKRIECRRKEHIKQRNLDSKRLLQRNRNVQSVLESKQAVESQRIFQDIKKNLLNNAVALQGGSGAPGRAPGPPPGARKSGSAHGARGKGGPADGSFLDGQGPQLSASVIADSYGGNNDGLF